MRRTAMDKFSSETIMELKRVAWPNRKETSGSTVVVLVVVVFFGLYLGLWDFIWSKLLQLVL
ncbi:MAG: preprotein translocase subunit SecE [Deltaproteobacteria bacterium RIFOXYA12_FULL_61_11]|nr:MAG: preprotein translocase subunit SecE [Deltaproteobacteria bacterium RIFOXYA12_FULL_61_11]